MSIHIKLIKLALAALLLALCHAAVATAGPKDSEVEAAVDVAIAEWAPAMTCHILEPEGFKLILELWNGDREKIVPLLVAAKVDQTVINRIIEKTKPDNVMIRTQGAAKDLIAYCNSHPDWLAIWTRFEEVPLFNRVKRVLKPQ